MTCAAVGVEPPTTPHRCQAFFKIPKSFSVSAAVMNDVKVKCTTEKAIEQMIFPASLTLRFN